MAGAPTVRLLAGTVVDAMPDVADKWIKEGVAMQDKSVEPQETKAEAEPIPIKKKTTSKKASSKRRR